jgi:hypothetical protein
MEHFEYHPDFYGRPIRLDKNEMSDPREALRNTFLSTSLLEMRQALWKMAEACVGTPDQSAFETPEQRQNLLLAYQDIEKALEAGWLLSGRGHDSQTTPPVKQ